MVCWKAIRVATMASRWTHQSFMSHSRAVGLRPGLGGRNDQGVRLIPSASKK